MMKPATNQPGTGSRPIELLTPEARKALKYSRRAYRQTATVRGRIGSTESRLQDWEGRVVAKGSTVRQWKSLYEEGLTLLADSGGVQLEVRQVEQQALKMLRAGLEAIHDMSEKSGDDSAKQAYRLLDKCERLRADELSWLDLTLAETHAILNLPASATPDQVLSRLELRRKVASRIDTRRRDAEQLELRAIEVLTGMKLPDDEKDEGEPPMSNRRKKTPAPVKAPVEPADPFDPEGDQPITGPLDDLTGELRRAADRVESIRGEMEGRIAILIERLEVEHATAIEEEQRQRAEVEEQLEELRALRKQFEERVLSAEKAAEELRNEMTELEKETRKERDRLASERSKAHARVLQAEQERDEALVLVSSLTRRLKTPGISEALSEEE